MSEGDWSGGGDAGGDWGGGGSGGDSFSEASSEGWLSRIGKAIVAIPIGLLVFALSFVLLFWNEGRSVRTARDLAEGKSSVVSVESGRVDPADEGKLVHVTGEATTTETLKDPRFPVSARALQLRRVVQIYQWEEKSERRFRRKLGGGEETVTTYSYNKKWSDRPIDSSRFKKPEGHRNPPSRPVEAWTGRAEAATLGAFKLPPDLVGRIGGGEPLAVGEAELDALPDDLKGKAKLDGGRFTLGGDPARPEVGDQTVAFEQVRPQVVSLLARQEGDTFRPYTTRSGGSIERIQVGTASAGEMFASAEAENRVLTWILRAVGFILMGVGLMMVLSPLSVLADVVPILGSIVGAGTAFVAFGVAAVLSLVTIALGWIAYRPVVGIALLVLAGAVMFGLGYLSRDRRGAIAT